MSAVEREVIGTLTILSRLLTPCLKNIVNLAATCMMQNHILTDKVIKTGKLSAAWAVHLWSDDKEIRQIEVGKVHVEHLRDSVGLILSDGPVVDTLGKRLFGASVGFNIAAQQMSLNIWIWTRQ